MKTDLGKILVTGSSGFVGRAFTLQLDKFYGNNHILTPSSSELNLIDFDSVENYFSTNEIDVVVHLAAKLGGIGKVTNRPLEYLESNLLINYNLVSTCIKNRVKKFVTLGSSCSYSAEAPLPTSEDELWRGRAENTYGVCKLILLEHLMAQNIMDWVYLIPPNIYGINDHFGENDAHFIPATVKKIQDALINHTNQIDVWGDGRQTRDFVYIDDLVYFLLVALTESKYSQKILNVATSQEISVRQIVDLLLELLGAKNKVSVLWDKTKPTGTIRKVLSNKKLLLLEPDFQFTPFKEGLSKVIREYLISSI